MAMAIALAASPLFRQFSIICLFFLLTISAGAQQQPRKHRFIVNSALNTSTSSKWISHSGEFAFGFCKVRPRLYLVGVWFDSISNKTLVWTANRDDGPVGEDSTLQLSSTGLQLSNSQSTVRRIIDLPGQSISAAEMRDDGNFVLLDSSNQSVWESFGNPTDTLLPGQTIKSPYNLYSSATNANYSTGRFVLSLQSDGVLTLFPAERMDDSYWSAQTSQMSSNPSSLNFDTNGLLSLVDASSNVTLWNASIWNETGKVEQFPGRVTLDADGILRGYIWNGDGDTSWIPRWQALGDPCQVRGQCGFYGICQMKGNLPDCTCPPGFDFVDSDDHFKGCSRNPSQQNCSAKSVMKAIGNTDWSGNDYALMTLNETECQQACIEDCMCVVAVFWAAKEFCWKKAMPLRDGKTGADRATFVKIVSEPSQPPKQTKQGEEKEKEKKGNGKGKGVMIVGFGIGLLVFSAILTTISLVIWLFGQRSQLKLAEGLHAFSYEELRAATEAFKHELGRGAFGEVYKGTLSDGRAVAVKKLKKAQREGEKEFRTEISVIGASHHKNLVQLFGFCDEGCHRLLVYEFVSNGSLDRALFDCEGYLGWKLRVQITLGIARGLFYLHEECRTQILHCDIKPQNILLDENYTAKISDFGMAKLIGAEQTRTFTAARGTIGYIAPEWQRNMAITTKVDVYSFGVMLLELICCRPMVILDAPENEIRLSHWIYDCLSAGTLVKLVEQQQQAECDSEIDSKQLERMVLVGLWCIQEDPALRPSIKKVVQMLEGTVEIAVPPPPASSYMGNNHLD